ncbi:MAG: hypothetical protein FK734_18375 [Asgard group archaeon]|nr:hypothetical protein [Asgard group archaeon]
MEEQYEFEKPINSLKVRKIIASFIISFIVIVLIAGVIIFYIFFILASTFGNVLYILTPTFGGLLPIGIICFYLIKALHNLNEKNQLFYWIELWAVILTSIAGAMLFIGLSFILTGDIWPSYAYYLCFGTFGGLAVISLPLWIIYIIQKRKAKSKTKE